MTQQKASNAPMNPQAQIAAAQSIMQNQIDTLQCTVTCLTTQRNAISDALTTSQTAGMMKDKTINALNAQIGELTEQISKYKAQVELWTNRTKEMEMRSAALTWYAEQLLTEIPDCKLSNIDTETLAAIVETYKEHLAGEKLKHNMARFTEIVAAKKAGEELPEVEVSPEPNNPDDADAVKVAGDDVQTHQDETEEPEIQLQSSLVKKDRPVVKNDEPVVTAVSKPSLAEQAKDKKRKIKGADEGTEQQAASNQ